MDVKLQGGKLLNNDGSLREAGYANQLVMDYSPADIKANKLRIKEWDYYLIINQEAGVGLATVVADNRYMGLVTATFFDYNNKNQKDYLVAKIFPMGKLCMPNDSSNGDIVYSDKHCKLSYTLENGGRRLKAEYTKSLIHGNISFDIFLSQPDMDTMVIATPWKEDKRAFYYNQKINCMAADGFMNIDGKEYTFNPEKDFATLDWGRGVWTYDNTWYWSSGNGVINGKPFGFNLGYGFGNTANATENMIFYDGKAHKLCNVFFMIPEDDIMKPWKFISDSHRFDMDFIPIYDNITHLSLGIISQNAHQVFGKLNGRAVLDNGEILQVDNLLCFAEKVRNRY